MVLPISIGGIIALLTTAIQEIRQNYIGRVSIFGNIILLWELFFPLWNILPQFLQLYLNVGLFIGLVAIITYLFQESLQTAFYTLAFIFYGSFTSAALIILFVIFSGS